MPPDKATRSVKAKGCPVCGKPVVEASKPFCSERCRNVDLGRWLSGSYVIPAREEDDDPE
ncbi:DNA gyrase inhibitor YacG [Bradyrhizobium prioriisuperbiae]|uniref:DNA gyrase inhibitor YacG n=1 Tax=Bradyrhizobium prioriisuperbiae TaxID=2854389 RepID=UPI0028E8DD48|nr:DNA gyrase inhibitor YacG [Bradyrhizobium prioritasuperba]